VVVLSFFWLIVAWSLFVVVDFCLVAPFFCGVVVVNLLLLVVAPVASLCFAAAYGPTRYVVTSIYSICLSSCVSPVFYFLLLCGHPPWRIMGRSLFHGSISFSVWLVDLLLLLASLD
jgi:hypothetical protein